MNLSPRTHTAEQVITLLQLDRLPEEGGWYRRVHEAGGPHGDHRRAWSMIFALFTADDFSALHRMQADELWIFQAGDALEALRLYDDGRGERIVLGNDSGGGQRLQDVVPSGVWQGARLVAGGCWALVSCVVVPEFRWSEFLLGNRADLAARFPVWADLIRGLTRD